jgi:undecaprenyl-diphosphatase
MDAGLPEVALRRLGPLGRYELRVVLAAAAVVLVGIPFGLLLQQVTTDGPLTALDESAAVWTNRRVRDDELLIGAMHVISFLGKPIFLLFAVGLPGLWLLRHGAHKLVIFLVVTCVGGGIVDTAVKVAVGRTRPQVDEPIVEAFGNSFPSGHSMSSLVCYGALLVVFVPLLSPTARRWAIAGAIALVLAIGASRLVLGVHYISDVAGGYALGAAWLLASVAVFETWRADRGRRTTEPLVEGVEPEETEAAVSA